MIAASPLRYPGGKAALSSLLARVRELNGFGELPICEPFAGGAGASLALLYSEATPFITINDADPAIYCFWWALMNRTSGFIDLLDEVPITVEEWLKQREVYRSRGRVSRLHRGFAAFYLNRCNRSGVIVNGGPIGGLAQRGEWKIGARFNRSALQSRCKRIVEYRDRIRVANLDGIELLRTPNSRGAFHFIDPPYHEKGATLYLNTVGVAYHEMLADQLRTMQDVPWVLTYDNCAAIRHLYKDWAAVRSFSIRYSAAERRHGRELLIAPRWLRLPSRQSSRSVAW